jgi:hypothetical protein
VSFGSWSASVHHGGAQPLGYQVAASGNRAATSSAWSFSLISPTRSGLDRLRSVLAAHAHPPACARVCEHLERSPLVGSDARTPVPSDPTLGDGQPASGVLLAAQEVQQLVVEVPGALLLGPVAAAGQQDDPAQVGPAPVALAPPWRPGGCRRRGPSRTPLMVVWRDCSRRCGSTRVCSTPTTGTCWPVPASPPAWACACMSRAATTGRQWQPRSPGTRWWPRTAKADRASSSSTPSQVRHPSVAGAGHGVGVGAPRPGAGSCSPGGGGQDVGVHLQPPIPSRDRHHPLQWLLAQRVTRARELLEAQTLTVETVAHRCGFSDAPTLHRHFARQTGTTPRAYRVAFSLRPSTERAAGPK